MEELLNKSSSNPNDMTFRIYYMTSDGIKYIENIIHLETPPYPQIATDEIGKILKFGAFHSEPKFMLYIPPTKIEHITVETTHAMYGYGRR